MSDAHAYDGRLWVVSSHLMAARQQALGLYQTNPETHGFPPMEDLCEKLDALIAEVQSARKAAAAIDSVEGE